MNGRQEVTSSDVVRVHRWDSVPRLAKARNPDKNVAIGIEVVKRVCKAGADVKSISYRTLLLRLWHRMHPEELATWTHDGVLDDALFGAIAQVNMKWMAIGVERQGYPFDEKEFFRMVKGQTQRGRR